jgi:purine-nucleoside phosphorylase
MKDDFINRIGLAAESLSGSYKYKPKIGIILGSGLGSFVESLNGDVVSYSSIKGFPKTTVEGHKGFLKITEHAAVMAGRFHFYEGWDMDDVILPVFVLAKFGIEKLIVTNAAGGINETFKPGDLVLIKDHINLMGGNPLIGKNNNSLGPRFPDMSETYSRSFMNTAFKVMPSLKTGVYAAMSGPSYETPAEIRMLKILGADMVGMSTVPEVTAANYAGLKILGISCITNMASGIQEGALSHDEVVETGKRTASMFKKLLTGIIEELTAQ